MLQWKIRFFVLFALFQLVGCASPYSPNGLTGGYGEKQLDQANLWRISFTGNGYTTAETAQTYWLYRAAELTLAQGFDGFEVLSDLHFSGDQSRPVHVATAHVIFVPMPGGPMPYLEGDIRLLKRPFQTQAGKIFDAAKLKVRLDPVINGPKCSLGNVCPHPHDYIHGLSEK